MKRGGVYGEGWSFGGLIYVGGWGELVESIFGGESGFSDELGLGYSLVNGKGYIMGQGRL